MDLRYPDKGDEVTTMTGARSQVCPVTANPAVDAHERNRDFLTDSEVRLLMKGAGKSRYPVRDQAVILFLYRHGLRESELCRLRLTDLDLKAAQL